MRIEESYNPTHKLASTSYKVRMLFILPALILALINHSLIFDIGLISLFFFLTLYICKTRPSDLLLLYKIPFLFTILGAFTLALSFAENDVFFSFLGLNIGFQHAQLILALEVVCKSFAIISIVFFGLLTHTISEISGIMHRIRIPKLFIELFVLTYKFILNLIDAANNMRTAQNCRLAYASGNNKIKAFSLLLFAVFNKAMRQSIEIDKSMEARCGTSFVFVSPKTAAKKVDYIFPLMLTITLLVFFLKLNVYA